MVKCILASFSSRGCNARELWRARIGGNAAPELAYCISQVERISQGGFAPPDKVI
jgi:hypothetical protein